MVTTPHSDPTIALAQRLIAQSSVSPDQSGAQQILIDRLRTAGFSIESKEFHGAKNFWAKRGTKSPLIVFSGHTDVVSPGDVDKWSSPPFEPVILDDKLFGRGAADMKGGIAAMVTAVEAFLTEQSDPPFSLGFLITGDEELGGASAKSFLEYLTNKGERVDYCIVGEPTSETQLGDTVKIGRRGSLNGSIRIEGKQGHVGYPHLADNAIHKAFEPLLRLSREEWGGGDESFQPTTFQISQLIAGIAANIIPGEAAAECNFRFAIKSDRRVLEQRVETILKASLGSSFTVTWVLDAEPFLTERGTLTDTIMKVTEEVLGRVPAISTGGGTSDARFFAKTGAQVVELGPINKSIHQIDEHVSVADLIKLSQLYREILRNLAK